MRIFLPAFAGIFLLEFMKNILAIAWTALWIMNPASAQTLYRCGNTFQQAPCDGDKNGALTINESLRISSGHKDRSKQATENGLEESSFNQAYLQGMPAVGMNMRQLERVMGVPMQVSARQGRGGQYNQFVYEKDGSRIQVQTRNGIVTSVQQRSDATKNRSARRKSTVPCPTELDIRNAKVGANSITLSKQERAKRLKAIEKMERCSKR